MHEGNTNRSVKSVYQWQLEHPLKLTVEQYMEMSLLFYHLSLLNLESYCTCYYLHQKKCR